MEFFVCIPVDKIAIDMATAELFVKKIPGRYAPEPYTVALSPLTVAYILARSAYMHVLLPLILFLTFVLWLLPKGRFYGNQLFLWAFHRRRN